MSINQTLEKMRKAGKVSDYKSKGNLGEDAVLSLTLELQNKIGGLVYNSFSYPYQSNEAGKNYTGNIKLEDGKYVEYTDSDRSLTDEIDILFVTPYRIFPVEVKAYHAKLEVYDHWFRKNGTEVDKSPILQAEKHARHLYHALHSVLPDGSPEYIVPMCCFVDRCKIIDTRSDSFADYIPISILNNYKSILMERNTPLKYNLSIEDIKLKLNDIKTDCKVAYT